MGFMMKAAANAASTIGRGSASRHTATATAKITYWARIAAERAIRAFCINPENAADEQCVELAKQDEVQEEFRRRLAEKDATFVAGCKDTPYTSACMARVGLPPFWQMLYDLCGWVCGLIWGIGSWFASLGPFSWALIILSIVLFFTCVAALADDDAYSSRSRRGRGWGPHLD